MINISIGWEMICWNKNIMMFSGPVSMKISCTGCEMEDLAPNQRPITTKQLRCVRCPFAGGHPTLRNACIVRCGGLVLDGGCLPPHTTTRRLPTISLQRMLSCCDEVPQNILRQQQISHPLRNKHVRAVFWYISDFGHNSDHVREPRRIACAPLKRTFFRTYSIDAHDTPILEQEEPHNVEYTHHSEDHISVLPYFRNKKAGIF